MLVVRLKLYVEMEKMKHESSVMTETRITMMLVVTHVKLYNQKLYVEMGKMKQESSVMIEIKRTMMDVVVHVKLRSIKIL